MASGGQTCARQTSQYRFLDGSGSIVPVAQGILRALPPLPGVIHAPRDDRGMRDAWGPGSRVAVYLDRPGRGVDHRHTRWLRERHVCVSRLADDDAALRGRPGLVGGRAAAKPAGARAHRLSLGRRCRLRRGSHLHGPHSDPLERAGVVAGDSGAVQGIFCGPCFLPLVVPAIIAAHGADRARREA